MEASSTASNCMLTNHHVPSSLYVPWNATIQPQIFPAYPRLRIFRCRQKTFYAPGCDHPISENAGPQAYHYLCVYTLRRMLMSKISQNYQFKLTIYFIEP